MGLTQTGLYSHRRWLETGNFGFRKKRNCTIRVAKTKMLISFAVTTKLICVFVFAYANCWFSQEAAHNDLSCLVGCKTQTTFYYTKDLGIILNECISYLFFFYHLQYSQVPSSTVLRRLGYINYVTSPGSSCTHIYGLLSSKDTCITHAICPRTCTRP